MKIIGHRGACGLAPENTLASINKALEHHVDLIEIDLRVTKDKVVILHHDKSLTTPTNEKLRISRHTYFDLKQHKKDLLSLEEVFRLVGRKKPFCLEVKSKEPVEPIVKVIKKYLNQGWQISDFMLGSKNQKTLLQLHEALPEIHKIVIESYSGIRARYRAKQVNTKTVSMYYRWLWFGFIKGMSTNYELYAYTLNNVKKARKWQKYGLAGVITDYPDQFKG